ncbi:hypothetical protein TNCV_2045031 [Trichonephila clavipes]|nr:hypothetical protein TNCV_2045031 [Trichonephila clavipes]
MTFDNALWKAAFIGIASNANAVIIFPQIKVRFVRKDNWLSFSPTGFVFISPLQTQPSIVSENAMANTFWLSVGNNIPKRWNTTENDVSKNQSSADSADFRIQVF